MNHPVRGICIFLVGTALAVAFNAARAHIPFLAEKKKESLPWIYRVEGTLDDEKELERHAASLEEVLALQEQGMPFLIDARKVDAYEKAHILGAINVPFNAPEDHLMAVFENCLPELPVVVYCEGATCESSKVVCTFLKESGFTDVKIYLPGYDKLVEAGLAEISGPGPYGDEGGLPWGDPNDPNDPNAFFGVSGDPNEVLDGEGSR